MRIEASRQRSPGQRQAPTVVGPIAGRVERPTPITMIALFQFGKAWLLLLMVVVQQYAPEALHRVPTLTALIYIAAHGRNTQGLLLPIIGIYVAIVGCGLWYLKQWARRNLIASSVVALGIWGWRFFRDWSDGTTTLRTPLEEQTVYLLVFLDLVVLLYLVAYDGVPQAFARD